MSERSVRLKPQPITAKFSGTVESLQAEIQVRLENTDLKTRAKFYLIIVGNIV